MMRFGHPQPENTIDEIQKETKEKKTSLREALREFREELEGRLEVLDGRGPIQLYCYSLLGLEYHDVLMSWISYFCCIYTHLELDTYYQFQFGISRLGHGVSDSESSHSTLKSEPTALSAAWLNLVTLNAALFRCGASIRGRCCHRSF